MDIVSGDWGPIVYIILVLTGGFFIVSTLFFLTIFNLIYRLLSKRLLDRKNTKARISFLKRNIVATIIVIILILNFYLLIPFTSFTLASAALVVITGGILTKQKHLAKKVEKNKWALFALAFGISIPIYVIFLKLFFFGICLYQGGTDACLRQLV